MRNNVSQEELVKLAEEKGYKKFNTLRFENNIVDKDTWFLECCLLQKWLRKIYKIDITIMIVGSSEYEYYIHQNRKLKKNNNVFPKSPKELEFLYEVTLEVALQESLKLI